MSVPSHYTTVIQMPDAETRLVVSSVCARMDSWEMEEYALQASDPLASYYTFSHDVSN